MDVNPVASAAVATKTNSSSWAGGPIGTRPEGTRPDEWIRLGTTLRAVGLPTEQIANLLAELRAVVDTAVARTAEAVIGPLSNQEWERVVALQSAMQAEARFGLLTVRQVEQLLRAHFSSYLPDRSRA